MGLSVTAGSRYAQTRGAALWSAARRAQVMNPEKLRDVYGSLIYLLQVPAGSRRRPVLLVWLVLHPTARAALQHAACR